MKRRPSASPTGAGTRRALGPSQAILLVVLVIGLVAAACSSDEPDQTTTQTIEPGDVATLDDGTEVLTQGILVISGDTRLCGAIADSPPPRCEGPSAILGDLSPDDIVALNSASDPEVGELSWTSYELAVSGTVDNGILVNVEIANRVYPAVGDGLRMRLVWSQSPFFPRQLRSGEEIRWAVDITNILDEPIELTFTSGQVAEVTLSDGDTEVYRWADGKLFTQEINEVEFEAGRTSGATLADLFVLDPGTYTLRAWVVATGAENAVIEAPVEVIEN